MPNNELQKLMDFFKGTKNTARAIGVTERTLLNVRKNTGKLRKPYKLLLEYFQNDPEQFREVVNAVAEGRPADWTNYRRRMREAFAARLVAQVELTDKVDDGTDLQV